MAKKKGKRITTKAVQAMENKPFVMPVVEMLPEVDVDPWGRHGITLRQKKFCEAYVGEAAGNMTKAAKIAGYRDDNTTSLAANGWQNLNKPFVRAYIGRLLAAKGLTTKFLKSRLAEMARSSLENFCSIDADGQVVIDMKQGADLGALSQIKEFREDVLKSGDDGKTSVIRRTVKMHDPTKAIEILLKMHGKLVDRHHISGEIVHSLDLKSLTDDELSDLRRIHEQAARRRGFTSATGSN